MALIKTPYVVKFNINNICYLTQFFFKHVKHSLKKIDIKSNTSII